MITRETNQENWEKLYKQWIVERKPAYLTSGHAQYQVLQLHDTGEIGFTRMDGDSMMGSSSMTGMVK